MSQRWRGRDNAAEHRPARSADRAGDNELSAVVLRLASDSPAESDDSRAKLLLRLASALGTSARQAGAAAVTTGRWLTDTIIDLAPHIPVRDLNTLQEHFPGKSGDALADALIDSAVRVTGGVGAAMGVLAGAEWSLPPTLLSAPVQVAAETVTVVAVELKLIAELHVVYGRTPVGSPGTKASAYLSAWARRRGLDPSTSAGMMGDVISVAAKRQLRTRLLRRTGSSTASVLPFFAGAIAGAALNAKATRRLGEIVAADLVRRNRRR